MLRLLIHSLCIFFCLATSSLANEFTVDLDKPVNISLLPGSEYFLDEDHSFNSETVKQIPGSDWATFKRDQFQFGYINSTIWVRSTIKTIGRAPHELLVDLHGIIDNIQLQVSVPNEQTQLFKFGNGTVSQNKQKYRYQNALSFIGKKPDTDHVFITLEPEKTYQFLLKIKSVNHVIGSYRIIEPSRLEGENRLRANGIVGYLFILFVILFYSSIIFVTTREKAFIFHILYTLSVTAYLLLIYNFFEGWFNTNNMNLVQKLLTFSAASILLSLLAFCRSTLGKSFEFYPRIIQIVYRGFLVGGIVTLLLILFIPYESIVKLLIIECLLAMVLAPIMAFYTPKDPNKVNKGAIDTNLFRLRITLLTFTIVGAIHLGVLLGLIKVHWFTNYILLLFVFIEITLFITVAFININNDKRALHIDNYYNRQSQLPNERSLEKHFLSNAKSNNHTLVYFWVSGFDRLEIALGNRKFKEFLTEFGKRLSFELTYFDYVVPRERRNGKIQTVFHTGKNNFSILCERLSFKDQQQLHKKIIEVCNLLGHLNHFDVDFKVMIGADGFYPETDEFETVVENCLLALAQGIKNKNNIRYYDESIRSEKLLRRKLVADFSSALKNKDLYLVWQSQYDVQTKKMKSVEVYSRWLHPEKGLLLPDVYVPLLEKSDRIRQLSRWVVEEVFKSIPLLHEHYPEAEVSINLSPQDILQNDFIDFIDEKFKQYEHLTQFIILEVSESVMVDDYSVALENIKQLQLRGFKISIERFGSGLASFAYLQSVPTNEIKIDKTFSERFTEPKTYAILSNIIGLAKRLDIRLVVEGLETQQQVDIFSQLGVERLQGWAISKPVALSELLRSVKNIE